MYFLIVSDHTARTITIEQSENLPEDFISNDKYLAVERDHEWASELAEYFAINRDFIYTPGNEI